MPTETVFPGEPNAAWVWARALRSRGNEAETQHLASGTILCKRVFSLVLNADLNKCPIAPSYPYSSEGRQNENHSHRKLTKLITWATALSSLMKLSAMVCRATQDGRVMVESSDKTWSTGEENGKPLQYSCLENPQTVWKGKKVGHCKMNSPSQ